MDSSFFLVIAAIISGLLWLSFLRSFEKVDPEPLKAILRVGLLGGLASGFCAGLINSGFSELTGQNLAEHDASLWLELLDAAFVGVNEESMKFFFTVLLIRHMREFDEPIDAAIYGATVALGFAVSENIDYAMIYGYANILVRSATSTPLHLATATIWGYGIAKAKFLGKERYLRVCWPYVAAAAAVHGSYNFLCSYFELISGFHSMLVALVCAGVLFVLMRKRLLYLASQTPFVSAATCLKCGAKSVPGAHFCQSCGTAFVHEFFKVCEQCDMKLSVEDSYCWKCGSKLSSGPPLDGPKF